MLCKHLLCAVAEESCDKSDIDAFWETGAESAHRALLVEVIDQLLSNDKNVWDTSIAKKLMLSKNLRHAANELHAARCFKLRNIVLVTCSAIRIDGSDDEGSMLHEMGDYRAFFYAFAVAIFLHRGKRHLVIQHTAKIASAQYYTMLHFDGDEARTTVFGFFKITLKAFWCWPRW